MPKRRARPNGTVTNRDKFNAGRKTRGTDDDFEWKLVKGVMQLVKKKPK